MPSQCGGLSWCPQESYCRAVLVINLRFHPHTLPHTLLRRTLAISFKFVLIYGFSSQGFGLCPAVSAIQLVGRWNNGGYG